MKCTECNRVLQGGYFRCEDAEACLLYKNLQKIIGCLDRDSGVSMTTELEPKRLVTSRTLSITLSRRIEKLDAMAKQAFIHGDTGYAESCIVRLRELIELASYFDIEVATAGNEPSLMSPKHYV